MDWSLISQRRSRLTVPISAILDEYGPFTLSSLMQYLKDSDIPGPFPMRDSIKGAKWLGEGAQFQVYGRHFLVEKDFEAFDKPYLESGRPRGQWGLIETTMECVAVKRAKILAPQVPHGSQPLTDLTRHAVGLNQLRDTIQEVLCLTSPPLRQHPNIVKLLAWGYDNHEERGENSFSPLLFMEQATMSLGVMCRTSEIPTGVKQHLCRGTAAGIKALHEYFIIHGDVKPDNVLVFASRRDHFSCTAKIADFGHSVRDFNQDTLTPDIAPQGTEGWSAPELRNQRTLRTDLLYRCDIWSLAMTIWSVLSTRGEKPCLSQCHRPGEFPFECEGTDVPWSLLQTLCQPLAEMVVSDPVDRIAHVENILKALELSSYKLTAEERSRYGNQRNRVKK
jgi:serine/threonine protein kinase